MKPVQISEHFDAPQFCMDFINTAERTIKCRALKVYVYKEKLKNGVVVNSKRTGYPLKSWQPYRSKSMSFKYDLNHGVAIIESFEEGIVVGRAEYTHAEPSYLIRYKCADGRAVEQWWTESALRPYKE